MVFTEQAQGAFLTWAISAFLEGNSSNLSWVWITSKEQEPFLWCFTCVAHCWGVGLSGREVPREQGQWLGSLLPWVTERLSREHLAPAAFWKLSLAIAISQPSLCPSNSASFGTLLHETPAFLRQAQQTPSPISQVLDSVLGFQRQVGEKE